MNDIEKIAKKQKNKELSKKIAEIIWHSVGGAIALCGVTCLILALIIINMGSNSSVMSHSPFYGLIEAQNNFKEWWNSWMFIKMSSYLGLGTWLVIIACAYELIVLAVYGSKQDAKEKRERAKKLRERNATKFKEEQMAAKVKAESEVIEAETTEEPATQL